MAFTLYNPSNQYPQAPAPRAPGPAPAPTNQSGLPNFAVLPQPTPQRAPNMPSQGPLPGGFGRPPARPPGSYILKDSNPVRYPNPIGSASASSTNGQWNPFPAVSGSAPQQAAQNVGGSILGSSTSQPSFYGGGLSPASGLGGGLYPSLLGLYR
jgi:hypothetical protein